jgi:RNA polymerase sigma factor, sigma-70 family
MSDHLKYIDQQIIDMLSINDAKAMTLLYNTYYKMVYIKVRVYMGDDDDADDLVQELFSSIWEKRKHLKLMAPLKGYLLVAAFNRTTNFVKTKRRKDGNLVRLSEKVLEKSSPNGDAGNREELRTMIKNAAQKLPEKTKVVFLLSKFFGLSNSEIAQFLNVTVKAVEKHITKALKLMRIFLMNEFIVSLAMLIGYQHAG